MNFWFWLLIILIPVIVFSVTPEANMWRRIGRLALASSVCYGLMFVTVAWQYTLEWRAIYAYQEQFHECVDHECAGEPISTLGGPFLGFVVLLGWIAAIGYTGLWELIWRLSYRKRIRALIFFKGRLFSNLLIIFALLTAYPTWLFLSRLAH